MAAKDLYLQEDMLILVFNVFRILKFYFLCSDENVMVVKILIFKFSVKNPTLFQASHAATKQYVKR